MTAADDYIDSPAQLPYGAKFRESMRIRGVPATLEIVAQRLTPVAMRNRLRFWGDRRFDQKYGVDTAGFVSLKTLEISSPSLAHASPYATADPSHLHEMLGRLNEDFSKFAFIDIGSGKGKALFLASEYPFREIVGVEFSEKLHEVAARNISRFRSRKQRCFKIECRLGDAAQFRFPMSDCIIYMFNPFRGPVMEAFLSNLRRSGVNGYVLYLNPKCGPMLDSMPIFQKVAESELAARWYSIYRITSRPGVLPS